MLKDNWHQRQLAAVKELLQESGEHARANELDKAHANLKEAAVILDSADEVSDEALRLRAAIFNELGILASRSNNAEAALGHYKNCIEAADQLAERGEEKMLLERVTTLVNMGVLYAATQNPKEGRVVSKRALYLLKQVEENDDNKQHVGTMNVFGRYHLALAEHMDGNPEEGREQVASAIEEGEKLLAAGIDIRPMMTEMFGNAARMQVESETFSTAAEYAAKGAAICLELFLQSKQSPLLQQYVNLQMDLVNYSERSGAFDKAEDALFKVLDIVPGNQNANIVKRGEAFYQNILNLTDEELVAGGLPREEAEESLAELKNM